MLLSPKMPLAACRFIGYTGELHTPFSPSSFVRLLFSSSSSSSSRTPWYKKLLMVNSSLQTRLAFSSKSADSIRFLRTLFGEICHTLCESERCSSRGSHPARARNLRKVRLTICCFYSLFIPPICKIRCQLS